MKEYRSRNSGRYVFNEDMHNLQELALSPVELFSDCGLDFVISGCTITITQNNDLYTINVASGFVYLDGKIRKVEAFTGTAASINSIGIYATQPTAPQITYFNGDTDFMYNDYAAEIRVNFDNSLNIACVLAQQNNSAYVFPNLRTAFFNHYCIMNNGTIGQINSLVAGEINVTTLKINSNNVTSLFVQKSGDSMNNNATLTFTKGNNHTVITGESITVDGTVSAENISLSGIAEIAGDITANSFIKANGTSSQFLKADGSVDNTVYATNSRADSINARFNNYLLLTGGTLTGELTINSTCLISGLLTLQAGLVGVNADLTGYVKAQKLEAIGEVKAASGGISGVLTAGSAQITGAINAGSAQLTSTLVVGSTLTVNSTATINGNTNVNANLTATKLIKLGGNANEFLKANGDVDNNTYALVSSLNNYLPLTGGTLTGNLTVNNANVTAIKFIKTGGTSSQFLKANGDVDSNTYLTTGSASDTYLSKTDAANTYLKQNNAATTYLTKTDASSTYLTTNSASNTYLTKTDAASTYLKQNDASNTYLTKTDAANNYVKSLTLNHTLSNYVLNQQLNNYMPAEGGTMTGSDNSMSYYTKISASGINIYNGTLHFLGNIGAIHFSVSSSNMSLTDMGNNQLALIGNFYASGTVTASNISSSSDERLKNKISNITLNAEQISDAPAILFTWKDNNVDKNKHIGTIAQYWQKILPESVIDTQRGLMIEYGPVAMISVISLAKEVVALKQEIAELKGQTN